MIGDLQMFRHSRLLAVPMDVNPEIEEAPTDARVYVYTNLYQFAMSTFVGEMESLIPEVA